MSKKPVATAIRQGNVSYTLPLPATHEDVERHMVSRCGVAPTSEDERGYVLSDGTFVLNLEQP
jgi:hypothetical protein